MKKIIPIILSIDQGTSSSRVIAIDVKGQIIAQASRAFRCFYPRPGWVEQDPEEIWQTVYVCIQEIFQKIKNISYEIVGIGITNQRETTILWERSSGKALGRAIVWQCRRSADICEGLKKEHGEKYFHHRTGLVVDPYFSATKILWRFRYEKGLKTKAKNGEILFGTVDSWLIWKLTGGRVHATDRTNASRTLLLNLKTGEWDKDLLSLLDIPHCVLPEVKDSIDDFGKTIKLGKLPSGIPISGVAGDQQAALFGQACFRPGMVKNTYGTGCFLLWPLGKNLVLSRNGLLTTWACFGKKAMGYALEGSIFIAGAAVQWLRDDLKVLSQAKDSEKIALSVQDNHGVYFVPAFTGLGSPYWNAQARGTIVGLTRGVGREHLIRATLEAIAYQTKDVVEAMEKEAGQSFRELRVDGGTSANQFLMQFQADILNCTVNRPYFIETTALGAGFMAGLGVGLWSDNEDIENLRKTEHIFKPFMKSSQREKLYNGWKEAVGKTLYAS